MEKIPNKEAFNILVGLIFRDLLILMPNPQDCRFKNYTDEMSFQVSYGENEQFFLNTINWLEQFGYIKKPKGDYYDCEPFVITDYALGTLNAKPSALGGESYGDIISKAAKDITTDAGKKAFSDYIGEFLGYAAGSFTKSMTS